MAVCIPIKEMKNTADFTEAVRSAGEPVFVTKNGREALVSMSPDVYEGLLREGTRARLYDVVNRGLEDTYSGRVSDARSVVKGLRSSYGL